MTAPVVLKLGGSLLTMPDLMTRLNAVLKHLSPAPVLIVPGGGFAADVIRDLDRRFQLVPEKAHRDAIAAMSGNAALLCRLNRSLILVQNQEQAEHVWADGLTAVLETTSFLFGFGEFMECSLEPLPASWDITSDSIAAWTARAWQADYLILAKSCDAPEASPAVWTQLGLIDPACAEIANGIPVEWLNLRTIDENARFIRPNYSLRSDLSIRHPDHRLEQGNQHS